MLQIFHKGDDLKPYKANIQWVDHASSRGWMKDTELTGLVNMNSFGFVVKEDKEYIVLSDTHDEYGQCRDPISIARKLIIKIKKVK